MKEKSVSFSVLFPPNMDFEYFEGHEEVPFERSATGCNLAGAWWLAESALISYEHRGFTRLVMRLIGGENFRFFSGSVTQAIVYTIHRKCVVAFRGTEVKHINSVADIISDINFAMVDFYGKGLVHKGFKLAFDEVLSEKVGLWTYVQELMDRGAADELYFTGHSLGGALATLAAVYLDSLPHPLVTFGAPRVGNPEFCSHLPEETWRFINAGDPVPYLPPNIPGFNKGDSIFIHGGDMLFFDQERNLTRNPAESPENIFDLLGENMKSAASSMVKGTLGVLGNLGKNIMKGGRRDAPGATSAEPDEDTPVGERAAQALTSLARDSNMDAHAPVLYLTNIWNHMARTGSREL